MSLEPSLFITAQVYRVYQSVQNLCSGFSYCLTILQIFYVWNGRGARPEEKKAAFDYAAGLSGDVENIIVLEEGKDDEDDMFWAVLGDGDRGYANAFHWTLRADTNTNDPHLWRISASAGHQVCTTHRAGETRLIHPSSRTSSPAPTHRLRMVSSFWTRHGRYLCSLEPKLGTSGRRSG